MIRLSLLVATTALMACAAVNGPAGPATASHATDTLTITLGASATSRDGALRVAFLRLVQDSRCAVNVTCVWEGDATVRLRADADRSTVEATIHTALDPRTLTAGRYVLSLLDVLPYPGAADSARTPEVRLLVRPAP
ncbi:MAG: hypothetical protein WD801_06020 [Gemmatimonadaceae bacterium]